MAQTRVARRRAAAEEVCWSVMLMIALGGLEEVPIEWRPWLGDPMKKWARLCVETGAMKPDEEPTT